MRAFQLTLRRFRGRGNRVDNTKDLHRFVFYGEWLENIKGLPNEQQMKIIYDMVQYGTGNEPQFQDDPVVAMGLNFVKGAIDKSKQDYINKINSGNNYGRKKTTSDNVIYNLAHNEHLTVKQIVERTGYGESTIQHSKGWANRQLEGCKFEF